MRLVFAGTPAFAATILEALIAGAAGGAAWQVVGVLTQPDRPAGRGRRLAESAVKQLARRHGIRVLQPGGLRDAAAREAIAQLDAELMVVAAYGLLLPPAVLALPRRGCINVHASLLPRWRGAAPIQHAILAGDSGTGVSIMQMDAGLDTGPVLHHRACPIRDDDSAGVLEARLAGLGAQALVEALPPIAAGTACARAQDEALATYAPRIEKSAAWIDWRRRARELERQVRAYDPWPVACTRLPAHLARADRDAAARRIRIWRASVLADTAGATPGTVLASSAEGIDVATADVRLRILELQAPGARRVPVRDYLNAHALPVGTRLENVDDDL